MKRIFTLMLCAAVLFTAALPINANAADLYPSDISIEDGIITKSYELTPTDNPEDIPTEEFERGGNLYVFFDMIKKENKQTDIQAHIHTESRESKTNNMDEVLKLFEPTIEITTEDGYFGTMALDHTTVNVEVDGYATRNYKVTATRSYPNLSAADVSLVPKTVEDNGKTLNLENVEWNTAHTGSVDNYDMAERYTATAYYSADANTKTVTGYTATAMYKGEVQKFLPGLAVYTAYFERVGDNSPETAEPTEVTETPETEVAEAEVQSVENSILRYATFTILTLGIGFAFYCLYRYKKIKKM